MNLIAEVERVLGVGGPVACSLRAFKPRVGQTLMAMEVARTIQEHGVLAVEAGTGIGKTFAYLIPVLLSGERALLSTATKALQDQLFARDMPRLLTALGLPVRAALLKGRGSYLCLQRLQAALTDESIGQLTVSKDIARVQHWSCSTRTGDLAELSNFEDESPIIPLVTSTPENCLGSHCPQALNCHVNRARAEAMNADIVVINHHLFFADLNVRESGFAELLPSVSTVVFDEAHHLNDIGIQFLGHQLGTGQIERFCSDMALQGPQLALALVDWRSLLGELGQLNAVLRVLGRGTHLSGRLAWTDDAPDGIDCAEWGRAVLNIHQALQHWDVVLRSLEALTPELQSLHQRCGRLMTTLDLFTHPLEVGTARWLNVDRQVTLVQSPLHIADSMRALIGLSNQTLKAPQRSWIFTSATLDHDVSMAGFIHSCGLEGARSLQVPSPFDYTQQAALYVPANMPIPSHPEHSAAVARLAAQGAKKLGGRTLVLTTTLRAMRAIGAALAQSFAGSTRIEVLEQGQRPKRELMERLRQGGNEGATGCILIASASFWEGIDVPGDALQLVIIDKLPFPPPGDPLVEARARQLVANGKNAFHHFHVPQTAIALKQGAGRLIRSETDCGILVVCDVRLTTMGYGKKIRRALPPMPLLETDEQFAAALDALTKPSTMDRCSAECL